MKTSLLLASLVLALAPRARAAEQAPTPAEALERFEPAAARWADWRTRTAEMEQSFTDHAANGSANAQSLRDCVSWIDKEKDVTLRRINDWRGAKLAQFRSQGVAGTLAQDEAARRAGYIERLYRIRMLQIYGNLLPHTLDECTTGDDGKPDGRLYAGPSWGLAASNQDLKLAEYALILESGLSDDDIAAR